MPTFGINQFEFLLQGAGWTVVLSALALVFGGIVAFAIALARVSDATLPRTASNVYVQLIQGTPLMVLMLICYFGFSLYGIDLPAIVAAALAMTLYVGAFLGEVWRGCLDAIPTTQWEAAESLGMSRTERMIWIILPQAIRISIPPTVTFMVQIVKNTSLASIIGFVELTQAGKLVNNATFQPFICFIFVAMIYFALCYPLTVWGRILERRFNVRHR
jgi:polar amino acid transport system permease protein